MQISYWQALAVGTPDSVLPGSFLWGPAFVAAALATPHLWQWAFGTLAIVLLFSGLDDFVPVFICLWHWLYSCRHKPGVPMLQGMVAPRRIAIFVPCWKESAVIGNMVRHNLAAIRYSPYDFFLGVYPNDLATVNEAQQLSVIFPNVHVAICPHPGPTSKADCLNSVFQRMTEFEEQLSTSFNTIVLHDAEDIIHPEALALIDRERYNYEMVQVPVLPLPTALTEITHGIYCDEFAEYQTVDMRARQYSHSFVPSCGVGTGFAREILDRLLEERGEVFDAASLTEDYEIGVYIHAAGYRQLFARLRKSAGNFIATREFFPHTVRTAIRQRTRWVTGISLQCWERCGWRGNLRTKYWFWRDRKGLIANPLSVLTNFLFAAGLLDFGLSALQHRPWAFAVDNPALIRLSLATTILQCFRISLRMVCVGRIFGATLAIGVPLRCFYGNMINCSASLQALFRYSHSRWQGHKLVWLKTEHAYPKGESLVRQRGQLADVLLTSGILSQEQLALAKSALPEGADLAGFLLAGSLVTEDDLCRAVSLHQGVVSGKVDTGKMKWRVVRSLPKHVAKRHGLLPIGIKNGRLLLAGAKVPSPEVLEELKRFTTLPIDFQLVTRSNYDQIHSLLY